jgi:hypothetical protein
VGGGCGWRSLRICTRSELLHPLPPTHTCLEHTHALSAGKAETRQTPPLPDRATGALTQNTRSLNHTLLPPPPSSRPLPRLTHPPTTPPSPLTPIHAHCAAPRPARCRRRYTAHHQGVGQMGGEGCRAGRRVVQRAARVPGGGCAAPHAALPQQEQPGRAGAAGAGGPLAGDAWPGGLRRAPGLAWPDLAWPVAWCTPPLATHC